MYLDISDVKFIFDPRLKCHSVEPFTGPKEQVFYPPDFSCGNDGRILTLSMVGTRFGYWKFDTVY